METDAFFYNLFKTLPHTLFELLGLPAAQARQYRFDAVEVKKALRVDGLFVPKAKGLPLYFLEVQFQHSAKFYANLFAKVFCYLEENDPAQDWHAVALFDSRRTEPVELAPFQVLLDSRHVHRIYLDEIPIPADPPPGLGILQFLHAPEGEVIQRLARLKEKLARGPKLALGGKALDVLELAEELLIRRFSQYSREEIRKMFHLEEYRKTKAFQETLKEGELSYQVKLIQSWLSKGKSLEQIAELLELPLKDVRRLAKEAKS